jgi:hypothetical protein
MELGDIDWRRGELTVRSKGGWRDPLPVPVDVGDAVVGYLSRRGPDGGCDELRRHLVPDSTTPALFVSPTGQRLGYPVFADAFAELLHTVGVSPISGRARIHDCAHVGTITTCATSSPAP